MANVRAAYENRTDEDLAALASSGDPSATDVLLNRYKDMVRAKARKYFMLGADTDDIVQEGMIGLFKAVQTYKPTGGASFRTYTNICVHNQILAAIEAAGTKKHAPLNSSLSLDSPASSDDPSASQSSTIGQMIPAGLDANPAELAIFKEAMSLMLSSDSKFLSPLEKQVTRMLQDGLSYTDIAKALGKPPKSIDNAMQRAKRKLVDFFS